jgi:aflatoxin B1 aldehyde reductase
MKKDKMDSIKLILGTMTFGPQVDMEGSRAMVQRFFEAGYRELDTAYVYNEGASENILGAILPETAADICLATKVHPRITGRLDGAAVRMQLEASLRRLRRDAVDILYFHFPDPRTPIEDALETCADLHDQGKFRELGLSNFPAWLVVDIWHLCEKQGWPKPGVYQGRYNGLSRDVERELFPALRKLGMRFYAFNPLAGGMLSGRYTDYKESPAPGRFTLRPSYRGRYWKESYFEAVHILTARCREAGIEPAEAAFRWLAHHSCLDPSKGDGIIIGASNMNHLDQNLSAAEKGPLPEPILNAFNAGWQEAKPQSPEYFKFYSR